MALRFGTGLVPEPVDYHQRYDKSEKGSARRARYNDTRNQKSVDTYLNKPFVAWDGEGGNETDGSHTYFLFANSDGFSLRVRSGISTVAIFEAFIAAREGVTHVGYGLSYDINMWLRDVPRDVLETLYQAGKARWGAYWMEWRAGKSFSVSRQGRRFLIYDVLPFFQTSFVNACDEYLGKDWAYRDEIIRDKARRGSFEWSEIDSIGDYNAGELAVLVSLCNELRDRLFRVDIRVSRWDGPGAIASSLYKKYGTKSCMAVTPPDVSTAAQYAYAGGRFEIIRKGHTDAPCYQYDLRSAYPSAIRLLPCLAHGTWTHRHFTNGRIRRTVPFGVYRIEVVNPPTQSITQPQPLWMRNKNGTVYFSEFSHGWYWSPEAQMAIDLGGVNVYEAWEYNTDCDCNPFSFVEALYNKRAALKRAGDGAHVGLKLGLNSLYGKLAQQIGWSYPPLKLPPYHCLEWAGWITSHCRSQMFMAALHSPDDVIAFETDAIFSRVELPLTIGERLGDFEETRYSSLTYLKSGMYFGTLESGKEVEKTRGINKGTITRDQMIRAIQNREPFLHAEQTRFVGLGQAMNQDMNKWRRWYTDPRLIKVALDGKRIDLLSREDARKDIGDGWQETQEGFHDTVFSHRYPVAWVLPDETTASPEGLSLDEMRIYQSHEVYE